MAGLLINMMKDGIAAHVSPRIRRAPPIERGAAWMPARNPVERELPVIEQDGRASLVGGFGDAGFQFDGSHVVERACRMAARGPEHPQAYVAWTLAGGTLKPHESGRAVMANWHRRILLIPKIMPKAMGLF